MSIILDVYHYLADNSAAQLTKLNLHFKLNVYIKNKVVVVTRNVYNSQDKIS